MIAGLAIAVDVWLVGGRSHVVAGAPVAQGKRSVAGTEVESGPYSLGSGALKCCPLWSLLVLEVEQAVDVYREPELGRAQLSCQFCCCIIALQTG